MKKYFLGLTAVLIAVAMTAFTKAPQSNQTEAYWFEVSNTIFEQEISQAEYEPRTDLPEMEENPFPCSGSTHVCAVGFTSYTVDENGDYIPDGQALTHVLKP